MEATMIFAPLTKRISSRTPLLYPLTVRHLVSLSCQNLVLCFSTSGVIKCLDIEGDILISCPALQLPQIFSFPMWILGNLLTPSMELTLFIPLKCGWSDSCCHNFTSSLSLSVEHTYGRVGFSDSHK